MTTTPQGEAVRLAERITEYLALGGLWNPESMNHDKVRDLLIDCRAALAPSNAAIPSADPVALDRHTLRTLASAMQKFAPHLALELTGLWDVTDLQNAAALEELLAAAGAVEADRG